ncbi:hypothetical protein DLAC_10325 [Tieghemostelium lacteum]|uniref:UBR-type domain-containing protein n=1 Tax=Tieghemostelium lacteum TaxID=361077 RepID=A0A151Z5M1_TIELA|nr:hypothetical protein DLAC_10325 [Tieghemostelium lacteum]|eukprot:KYQ89094.1 hypothetical protein DLAC_10325 [Tieghemostelium lacteum]
MDPDLLLAIALSESLMVSGYLKVICSQDNLDNNDDDNNNNNNNKENENKEIEEKKPEEKKVDRLNIYFKDLLVNLKKSSNSKDGVNVKPLFALLKYKSLTQEQILFLSKSLEYISFLIIDGKTKDLNVNIFSRNTIEFCLNTLEGWCSGEIQFTGSNNQSTKIEVSESTQPTTSTSIANSVVMILLSIIDMLCCIEFPSTDIDKSFIEQIPSFANISPLDDILPPLASEGSSSTSGDNKEDQVMESTSSTQSAATGLENIFNQFLKNGLEEEKLLQPATASTSGKSSISSIGTGANTPDNNETLVKNNSSYFNNVLKGPSRLLSICSRLLLPYQSDLVISERYEDFKKSETTTCQFINYVQDILFSEGFDTLDFSSIPWIIDFIGRLIGTSRSYQSYDLKNHLSYRNSRFLSRQLFEMIFQVLGTKLNHPDLRLKAEIFFSLCILSDAEKLNINIDDLISLGSSNNSNSNSNSQDQQPTHHEVPLANEMILDPQLILLAITLVFNHLDDLKNYEVNNLNIHINDSKSSIITPTNNSINNNNNNNNQQPITKFLISNLDNESIWFDFLTPNQFTYSDISNLFMKSQLLDSLFSILYISFQKRKDLPVPMNTNVNINNTNEKTPTGKQQLSPPPPPPPPPPPSTTSTVTKKIDSDEEMEDDSYEGDIFGLLFNSEEPPKTPVKTEEKPKETNSLSKSQANLRKSKEGDIIKSKFYTILSYIHDLLSDRPQFIELLQKYLKLSHLKGLFELLSGVNQPDSWTLPSSSVQKLLVSTCYLLTTQDVISPKLQVEFIDYILSKSIKDHPQTGIMTLQKDSIKWLAWIFVKRQSKSANLQNDYLVKQIWENFTGYLKVNLSSSNSSSSTSSPSMEYRELISLEYIYLLMFSYHTLDELHRLNILKCFGDLVNLILSVQDHYTILSNSLLISRFMMIFNYCLFNFNGLSKTLSQQFYDQLLSCTSTTSKTPTKSENYYQSLVSLPYQSLIAQLDREAQLENVKAPVFYELKFTDSHWLSGGSSLVAIFGKLSIPYESFYRNVLLLTTSSLQFLYTLPPSSEFIEKMKDPLLFHSLSNDSAIYLTFLKTLFSQQAANTSLFNSIPWLQHTKELLTSSRSLLKSNDQKIFRVSSVIQCVQSYLCTVYNSFSSDKSQGSPTKSDGSGEYFEGWDTLFEDESFNDKNKDKEDTTQQSKEVEMKDKESTQLSPTKSKPTTNAQSFNDLLGQLFEFLIDFISHYKKLYRQSLASQLKGQNVDLVDLLLDVFANIPKAEVLSLMDSLGFSQELRQKVDKWDQEYNLDDTLIMKSQKPLFGWILQPYHNTLTFSGPIQFLIKSQLVLSMYAMNHLEDLTADKKDQDHSVIVSHSLALLYEIYDLEYDKKFKFSKNHHDVIHSDLSVAQHTFLHDLYQLEMFEELAQRVLKLTPTNPEIVKNQELQSILCQHIDNIISIAKTNPVHVYCHYVGSSSPMGNNFKVTLPLGDTNLLLWISMNNSNEMLNLKVLQCFNTLLSLPTPSDFLLSMRSHIVQGLMKLPVEDLAKWFEQKSLGRVIAATETSKQELVPTAIEVQELLVKFIGLISNNKEFATFTSEINSAPIVVQPLPEKKEEEDDKKKKKPTAAKKKDDKTATPPLSSTPVPNVVVPPVPDLDWTEKLPPISPLLLDILLSFLNTALEHWIYHPKLLKAYFGLLLYTDVEQHQLLRLFREVSKITAPSVYKPTDKAQLESLNYILEFIENVFSMVQQSQPRVGSSESSQSVIPMQVQHVAKAGDQVMTDTNDSVNILYDSSEEDVDNDKTNFEDDDDKDWKSMNQDKNDDGDDDDQSEEKRLASKLCTYTYTKNDYIDQHWYFCYTCGLKFSEGCCSICVKVCHKGHAVSYSRFSRFFCDCGAGASKGSPCKALKPRPSNPPSNSANSSKHSSNTKRDDTSSVSSGTDSCCHTTSTGNCGYFFNIPTEDDKTALRNEIMNDSTLIQKISELYHTLVELYKSWNNITPQKVENNSKVDLFATTPKEFIAKTDLFTLKKTSKYSAFDVKLKYDGPEGNQMKQLITNGPIQRAAMASSSKGLVAVAEQDQVSIVNISKILDDDATIDKNSFKATSKSNVGFPVVSMVFNPSNERYLAVAGYKECKVLTINQKDEIVDQLPIDLSLEFLGETNYLIKVEWVIGSQVELVVITNEFIKVYDLSKDNISPSHFFSLLEDSIRDICLVSRNNKNYILALSASGMLYCQSIDPYSDDNESCIMIETLQLPVVKNSPGAAIVYCQELDIIICTFTNGEAYALEINQQMTEILRSFSLQDPGKKVLTPSASFLQVSPGFPNLFSCLASRGTYLVTMKLTAKEVQIQSLKLSPKVEGMTWLNRASPKLLVLYDDGSLARYDYTVDTPLSAVAQTPKESLNSSGQKKLDQPGLDIIGYIKQKQSLATKKSSDPTSASVNNNNNNNNIISTSSLENISSVPQFPIDFFERTECITTNVKYGGDPLNSYTQEIIKQKLASNDDYIVGQNLDSLSLIIYNNDNEKVMCGIRVLLGNASLKHVPTEIRVFSRVIPVTEGIRRWYDIPLTIEETAKSQKKLSIVAGSTYTMGNGPIIDQVEVYAIPKDQLPDPTTIETTTAPVIVNPLPVITETPDIPLTPIEQSLLHTLHSLHSYFSLQQLNTNSDEYLRLKQFSLEKLPPMMTDTKLSFLRPIVKELLKILTGDHDSYLNLKHSTLLKYTNQTISGMSKCIQGQQITLTEQDTDTLFYLVKVLKKIVTEKPKNLTEYLLNDKPNFLHDLIQIYRLATQSAFNKTNPSICTNNNIITLLSDQFISNLSQLIWYCLKLKLYSCNYIFDLLKQLLNHQLDVIRSKTSLALVSLINQTPDTDNKGLAPSITSTPPSTEKQKKDEDVQMSEEEEVQYYCDNCKSETPIQLVRWHCQECGDYDLCDKCHSDLANVPHAKDHTFVKCIVEDQHQHVTPSTGTVTIPPVTTPSTTVDDMNIDDEEIDEELKLAISMSLSVETPSQSSPSTSTLASTSSVSVIPTTANEDQEDSILLLFKYALNELVATYEKGFASVIPYLQIIHSLLTSHCNKILASNFINDFAKIVVDLLQRPTKNLDKYLSQKTIPLESDTNLILLLSILLDSDVVSKDQQQQSNSKNHLPHTFIFQLCNLLADKGLVDLLKLWLESIFKQISKSHAMGQVVDSPFGALLVIQQSDTQNLPKNRYSPFFVKSLPRDINAINLTITKAIFVLMTSFYRVERRKQQLKPTYQMVFTKTSEWVKLACGFIHSKKTQSLEKYPKKLLLLICKTKSSYYSVRDEYLLHKKYTGIIDIEKASKGFKDDLNYDQLTKLISSLSLMLEVAYDRPKSWQYFVSQNLDALPNLFNILFKLEQEPTSLLLELLTYVFVDDDEKKEFTTPSTPQLNDTVEPMDIDMRSKHVQVFMNEKLLNTLIYNLLLESNLSDLRSNASNFMYYLWKCSDQKQKLEINKLFWQKLDKVVAYGKNSNEFMELLTYFINEIDPVIWKDQYQEFSDKFVASFQEQNRTILNHPNSQIYNSLSFILDFEDYYLEAEPCLVCNNPEVQYQTCRLDTLKQEVKFTESTQLIKFNNVYNIQKLVISIHDLKKGKMIKSINLYYNNKPVADIGDLKGKFNQWKKLKQVHFAPSQTERTINFQIPISARNFMIEYFDFHDNLSAGEKLTCPRCSRIVADKHGICKHCHENAFQCKQCRNINYENLDGFLCNECGFCKHARFEYSFTCKPTVSIEKIENQEDHKRAIATIDKESENAHKKYQRLLGFKKIISNLITSFETQEPWPKEELFISQQAQQAQQQPPPVSTTQATTANASAGNGQTNTFLSLRINKKIGYLSRLYEKECKNIFEGLSKSIQILQTNRTEIAKYLNNINKQRLQSHGGNHDHDEPKARDPNNCFGCSTSFVEECLSFLDHLSRNPNLTALKEILVQKGICKEMFIHNIHHGKSLSRTNARMAISHLTKNNLEATDSLSQMVRDKIYYAIDNYNNVDVPNLVSAELQLVKDCSMLSDQLWQQRFRFIMELFFKSIDKGSQSPVISEFIVLPCLKIILSFCTLDSNVPKIRTSSSDSKEDENQKTLQSKFEKLKSRKSPTNSPEQTKPISSGGESKPQSQVVPPPPSSQDSSQSSSSSSISVSSSQDISLFEGESSVKYDDWLSNPDAFDQWTSKYSNLLTSSSGGSSSVETDSTSSTQSSSIPLTKSEKRERYLATKYLNKWKSNIKRYKTPNQQQSNPLEGLFEGRWVKKLLFNSTSSIRTETLSLMSILSRSSPVRTLKFLDLFEKMIPFATTVGEYSAEFFGLFNKIIQSDERKLYLTVRGFIPYLCDLIVKEIERIKSKESSFNTDVSQGFVLKTLISILMGFMDVNTIKMKMKRDNIIEMVLDAFLSLRGVIIQKNKLTEDSVKQLQDIMKTLNTESTEDNKKFMAANIKALQKHSNDGRTPIFIYEQLCNIVCPTKPEPVYQMTLTKSSTQEEYIRGAMNRNPYSSSSIGLLMRDVKNKICKTLDLGSFLDDDNGMELLVDNKIIKLDLPIKKVYEQVWRRSQAVQRSGDMNMPMSVIYRLQGLDGEATEEIIENLPDSQSEEKDPEEEFEITSVMAECGGLNAMLTTIEQINDFTIEKELAHLVVKLLFHCCKIKVNRQKLITLNTVGRLLEKLKNAFHQPDIAENLLIIIESVVSEANRDYNMALSNSGSNLPTSGNTLNMQGKDVEEAKEQMLMFLDKLNSPLVRSNPKIIKAMTRIIPFLTYGHIPVMESFVAFFDEFLDFKAYDQSKSKDSTHTYHLDFFTQVSECIRPDSNGFKLRSLIMERGITQQLVEYIINHFPEDKDKTSQEWLDSLQAPALPFVLVLFRGLAMGHEPTQTLALKSNIIKRIHILEETSTSAKIGSLSENLLETLMEGNDDLGKVIKNIRKESKQEKLRQAEKHREDVLKELGLSQTGKHVTASSVPSSIEDLEEDEGFTCMVCREGFSFKPEDVLGIYTYSKRIPLLSMNETTVTNSLSPTSPSGTAGSHGFTTVTHFNIIHFFCHRDATKADRSMKVPKEEWEGAALRNQQTKCNNIFPIQGPKITNDAFSPYCDKYFNTLNNITRFDGPRFRLLAHDLKLLVLRFAKDESFSSDSKGGGKESNIRIVPFFVQFGMFLLDQKIVGTVTNQIHHLRRPHFEKLLEKFLNMPLETAIQSMVQSSSPDNVPYFLVLSLYLLSPKEWETNKFNYLTRTLLYAFAEYFSNSKQPSSTEESPSVDTLFTICRPWLIFYSLIAKFHQLIRPDSLNLNDQNWIVEIKSYLANSSNKIQTELKGILSAYQDELKEFADFMEFFDDLSLLKNVMDDSKDSNQYAVKLYQSIRKLSITNQK